MKGKRESGEESKYGDVDVEGGGKKGYRAVEGRN